MNPQYSARKLIVAVLDDEAIVRRSLLRFLKVVGIQATAYSSPLEFLQGCMRECPDCAVIDVQMPVLSGVEVLERLKANNFDFPVIVLAATDDGDVRLKCQSLGVRCFLLKPVEGHMLLTAIDSVCGRASSASVGLTRNGHCP
jgi:FixJ family two-component response regulator